MDSLNVCAWCGRAVSYERYQRGLRKGYRRVYCGRGCKYNAMRVNLRKKPTVFRRVVCVNTGEVFHSMAQAERRYGYKPGAVWAAIHRGRPLRNGLRFDYVD